MIASRFLLRRKRTQARLRRQIRLQTKSFLKASSSFPSLPVVTEEQANSQNIRHRTFYCRSTGWNRIYQKTSEFTVNIALVENGRATRGIVYAPAIRRLFYTDPAGLAIEEHAPFTAEKIGKISRISVKTPDNEALILVASKSHRDQNTDAYISKYAVSRLASAGSSLKFCLLAAGEADFYPRLGRTMEWDTAAGHAILKAAGGDVLDFDTHEPLEYGKPQYENPFFIALTHGVILKD